MDQEPQEVLMRVLTPAGQRLLWVPKGSPAASMIGRHFNAIKRFRNGETDELQAFKNMTVTGLDPDPSLTLVLASDPEQIKKWAKQGELDDVDPYTEMGGAGDA